MASQQYNVQFPPANAGAGNTTYTYSGMTSPYIYDTQSSVQERLYMGNTQSAAEREAAMWRRLNGMDGLP